MQTHNLGNGEEIQIIVKLRASHMNYRDKVLHPSYYCDLDILCPIDGLVKKGLSFISNRQRRKEGTFCASGLAGIEPTPPAPEEQGMRAFRQLG